MLGLLGIGGQATAGGQYPPYGAAIVGRAPPAGSRASMQDV